MKIAIDLSSIIYDTGVSHYQENLVKNLLRIDNQNEYILYGGSFRQIKNLGSRIADLITGLPNAVAKVFPIPPRLADIIWNKLHILPIEKLIGQVDLIHTSDWTEPPSSIKKVTTIHDLVPLFLPKFTPKIIVETHKARLAWVTKESEKIIVPSLSTANDLISLGVNENKVKVIYESPNHNKATNKEVDRVRMKYGIHDDYIISIGANPRKNIPRSIEAFHLSKSGKNLKYMIVGNNISGITSDHKGVRFLGHVPEKDMSGLITGAKIEVFVSLYEGFGIPILDAFNCEVPVVTSNISSMPEAAGGAAILVDPYNVNSIADGIEEALKKPKTLIDKGLKRVKDFSWEKTAKETLNVYTQVVNDTI